MVTHEVQLFWLIEHVRQGEIQGTQTLLTLMVPVAQFVTQLLPSKLLFLQAVQLEGVTEHVLQSPLQATATPDILTYPVGT